MNLNAVDLYATHGWRLSRVDGHLDQPARKKILKIQGYQSKDLKYEGRRITVTLIQSFAAIGDIFAAVDAIHDQLSGEDVHTVEITEHGISFYAVARDGAKTDIRRTKVTVTITFTEVTI